MSLPVSGLQINGFNALPIKVSMAISGVCLRCPVVVEILVPFECSAEVSQGSHVNLTLSVGEEAEPTQILGSNYTSVQFCSNLSLCPHAIQSLAEGVVLI